MTDYFPPDIPRRRSFLLRAWEERGGRRGVTWRFSLLDAESRELCAFASLEMLVAFLEEMTAAGEAAASDRKDDFTS